jgi:OFA family oxalate/formate antiporter-like MFS transporter
VQLALAEDFFMVDDRPAESPQVENLGWRVTLAGLGINLALGILYTWSVISKRVPDDWQWSQADKSWPYSIACLVFCLVMVPAGRMQDRLGPRIVATMGGVLVGLGMVLASFTTTVLGYTLSFGVLTGAGIGMAYASATPPSVKWFPAAKTGLIAGLVVSGFGLASVYAAPLSVWLIEGYGLQSAVMTLGIAFFVVVIGLSQLLAAPPAGFVPEGAASNPGVKSPTDDPAYSTREMLGTWQYYALWLMYACGAGAGLMIISKLAKIASVQAGITLGFVLVAALALGNGAGRVVAGMASDKIGRKATLAFCFLSQALLIMVLSQTTAGSALASTTVLAVISALIGANYGANLALFPALTKDYYGLKNFGMYYGMVFTAWGVGGFMLALLAGKVYDTTQSFEFAYYTSAVLLIAAAILTAFIRPPQRHLAE